MKNPPPIKECRRLGKKKILKLLSERNDIIAAYSDGSVARNDMIPGSDIDIGIIVDHPNEPRIEKSWVQLIEWGFIPKNRYEKIPGVLSNAGFTQNIVHTYIYFDPTGFFSNFQAEILQKKYLFF